MQALVFAFLASGCTALSSLLFRKNTEKMEGRSASGYLVLFYLVSFMFSVLFYHEALKSHVNYTILGIGACVGLLNSILMFLTSRALSTGPAGLTFAFQNASAIFPGLILFALLGSDFGYSCSLSQLLGMFLVLFGLFLGAKKELNHLPETSSRWLKYALACFAIQVLALTCIQARCLLFGNLDLGIFLDFTVTEADDAWFMPGQFGVSFITQAFIFLREHRKLNFKMPEVIYGCLSGVTNFGSTGLLLLATKYAGSFEKGILFPCFAVAAMVLCNVWANRLYRENFNFKTNILCAFGIFMAVAA